MNICNKKAEELKEKANSSIKLINYLDVFEELE